MGKKSENIVNSHQTNFYYRLVLQVVYGSISASLCSSSEPSGPGLADIPPWLWLIAFVWPLLVIPLNEVIKRREIRYFLEDLSFINGRHAYSCTYLQPTSQLPPCAYILLLIIISCHMCSDFFFVIFHSIRHNKASFLCVTFITMCWDSESY